MHTTSRAAIELAGVYKSFGDGDQKVVALEDVSLTVGQGEFVSLIGPSGCGKSTLLRIVADLLQPTNGQVDVAGQTARRARQSRQVGVVFQRPVLYDWRSIVKNVELPLEIMGTRPADRRRNALEMLDLVGLGDFAERHPWELSGGMQQRVAIARALSYNPEILLMDEPFGALDEITRERMNLELQRIWMETKTTVLFITHSISEAVFLSDRVVVMSPRPGRIVLEHEIPFARPRDEGTRKNDDYFHAITFVREALRE